MSKLHQTQQTFFVHFRTVKSALEELIESGTDSATPAEVLERIETSLASLQSDVQKACAYLAPYDQRVYATVRCLRSSSLLSTSLSTDQVHQQQLDQLSADFETLKARIAPRTRFAFSRRRTNGSSIHADIAAPLDPTVPPLGPIAAAALAAPGTASVPVHQVLRVKSKFVAVPQSLPTSSALLLSHIEDSIIYVPPDVAINSVQVSDCSHSILLFAGPVQGAIYLSRVVTSVVVIHKAHQVRMHESTDTDLIIGDTGGRIIEKCDDLIIAKLLCGEDGMMSGEAPFTESIDDFSHPLGVSPNWTSLDEDSNTKFTEKEYKKVVELATVTDEDVIARRSTAIKRTALSREFAFETAEAAA
ncbi:uncharacterized protein V1518DRAFT_410659, partial [Limtongia smithiae]|uniref:uncharacterized protein n=1 Tax=Limtongia smithiae TaxID=1125753 RepID=UPI0034CD5029